MLVEASYFAYCLTWQLTTSISFHHLSLDICIFELRYIYIYIYHPIISDFKTLAVCMFITIINFLVRQ